MWVKNQMTSLDLVGEIHIISSVEGVKKIKKKLLKRLKWVSCFVGFTIIIGLIFPTWTPKIYTSNGISELKEVEINGTNHEVMIRGTDVKNPVIIFVHGGPGCSEIPYVRKYQDLLEDGFTVVHYDQRASGKSYHFFEDYSNLSKDVLVDDLLALTEYISNYFRQEKVILIGHSYGTYIATQAASKAPEKYKAYIGIGQMSNLIESELDSLNFCILEAELRGNTSDSKYLKDLTLKITTGERITPRKYVRKYGGASRLINDNEDCIKGLLFGSEYNLLDTIRYYCGVSYCQDVLIKQAYDEPLPDLVTSLDLPFYFILGKYDYMTSASAAKNYFDSISTSASKKFILYEDSAHYPQFEEEEKFYNWICDTFTK